MDPRTHSGETEKAEREVRVLSARYARRLFGIVLVVGAAALVVRALLVPATFGEQGHYRSVAPEIEAARTPVHQGKAVCAPCHESEFERHERDVHVTVNCEDCHGAAADHVKARTANAPAKEGELFRELEQANCLACHRPLLARPNLFPTVSVEEHFALVGVSEPGTVCQECHDPHAPLQLERPVAEARIHPLIHPCGDCHTESDIASRTLPEGHVVTFRCADCHATLVTDAESKAHGDFDCRICHVFRKDSEFSGRIFKNGNPKFCLMCHEEKPFKSGETVPLIASFESHLDDVADEDEDRQKRCVDCHMEDAIHVVQAGTPGDVSVPDRQAEPDEAEPDEADPDEAEADEGEEEAP